MVSEDTYYYKSVYPLPEGLYASHYALLPVGFYIARVGFPGLKVELRPPSSACLYLASRLDPGYITTG